MALEAEIEPATLRDWLATNLMAVPNVAGPRENKGLRVYQEASRLLETLLEAAGA